MSDQRFHSRGGEYVGLGSLESRVLRALYTLGDWASVHEVWCCLQDQKPIARDAVLTCMKRMASKGFLESRKDEEGAWRFRPAASAEEIATAILSSVWRWLKDRPPPEVTRFLGDALMGELDAGQVEELRELAQARFGGKLESG